MSESGVAPESRSPASAQATADPHSVLQGMLPSILRLLRREPAIVITIAYLLVALVGIAYDERYYGKFGIPVLTLSQISDFLVAGIQQPIALLLLASTLPMCWIIDRINTRSRRSHAVELERLQALPSLGRWQAIRARFLAWRLRARWYTRLFYLALVLIYGSMFVSFYAEFQAGSVKRGEAMQVRVHLSGDANDEVSMQTWSYLGAVSSYVFLYDTQSGRSLILPVDGIASIEPIASAKGGKTPLVVPIP